MEFTFTYDIPRKSRNRISHCKSASAADALKNELEAIGIRAVRSARRKYPKLNRDDHVIPDITTDTLDDVADRVATNNLCLLHLIPEYPKIWKPVIRMYTFIALRNAYVRECDRQSRENKPLSIEENQIDIPDRDESKSDPRLAIIRNELDSASDTGIVSTLRLTYEDGKSSKEIAKDLSLHGFETTAATIRKRVERERRRLRARLEKEFPSE